MLYTILLRSHSISATSQLLSEIHAYDALHINWISYTIHSQPHTATRALQKKLIKKSCMSSLLANMRILLSYLLLRSRLKLNEIDTNTRCCCVCATFHRKFMNKSIRVQQGQSNFDGFLIVASATLYFIRISVWGQVIITRYLYTGISFHSTHNSIERERRHDISIDWIHQICLSCGEYSFCMRISRTNVCVCVCRCTQASYDTLCHYPIE